MYALINLKTCKRMFTAVNFIILKIKIKYTLQTSVGIKTREDFDRAIILYAF